VARRLGPWWFRCWCGGIRIGPGLWRTNRDAGIGVAAEAGRLESWHPSRWLPNKRHRNETWDTGSLFGGCLDDGWRKRHQSLRHPGLSPSATTTQRPSREARARVGYPSTRRLGDSVGFERRRPPTGNGMSQRVHLKTSRLQRLGDEVSLYASLQRFS